MAVPGTMSTVAFSLHKLNQLFKSKGRIEIRPPAIDVYVHIIRFTDILRIQELEEIGHHFPALTPSLAILIRSPASNGPSWPCRTLQQPSKPNQNDSFSAYLRRTQALFESEILEHHENQAANKLRNELWSPAALGTNGPNNRWFHHLQSCKSVNTRRIAWKDY